MTCRRSRAIAGPRRRRAASTTSRSRDAARLPLGDPRRRRSRADDRRADRARPPVPASPLVVAGLAIGAARVPAPDAARARCAPRAGLPAAVLLRGILTFAFFGVDAYVALALVGLARAVGDRGRASP